MPDTTRFAPIHYGLFGRTALGKLARALDEDRLLTYARLVLLWVTAAQEMPTGDVAEWGEDGIADVCRWNEEPARLLDALVEGGWLDRADDGDGLRIHNWEAYAGKMLRRKEAEAARQRKRRAKGKATDKDSGWDNIPLLPMT